MELLFNFYFKNDKNAFRLLISCILAKTAKLHQALNIYKKDFYILFTFNTHSFVNAFLVSACFTVFPIIHSDITFVFIQAKV